jgi:hypothetical protein
MLIDRICLRWDHGHSGVATWYGKWGARSLARIAAIGFIGAVSACATAPLQETKTFQLAFVAVDTVGQPLLDDLATAQRLEVQQLAIASAKRIAAGKPSLRLKIDCNFRWQTIDRTSGFITGFCGPDAPYYSKIGDPPKTAEFRKALALIGEFAQALTALADGTSAAAASAQAQQLARNFGSFAETLAGATGVGSAIAPAVNEIATALSPLVNQFANIASADQERRVVVEAQPKVTALIKALHDGAPSLFGTLIQQIANQIELEDRPQPAEAARIDGYRLVISDYMRLLDRLNDAWNQLVIASKQPSNPTSLATLTVSSGQLAADAATVRQSLTALRFGAAPK